MSLVWQEIRRINSEEIQVSLVFEKGEYMKEDRLNYIEKEISKTPLYSLLGSDGIGELKSRIIDIICDQVQREHIKKKKNIMKQWIRNMEIVV